MLIFSRDIVMIFCVRLLMPALTSLYFSGMSIAGSANNTVLSEMFGGKCGIAFVNRTPYSSKVAISENHEFIVKANELDALIYKKSNKDYELVSRVELQEAFPRDVLISNSGYAVFYGNERSYGSGVGQSDIVFIYNGGGQLVHSVSAGDVLTDEQVNTSLEFYETLSICPPKKPWICHSEVASVSRDQANILVMYDTLSGKVHIDLVSGIVTRREAYDGCEMFD